MSQSFFPDFSIAPDSRFLLINGARVFRGPHWLETIHVAAFLLTGEHAFEIFIGTQVKGTDDGYVYAARWNGGWRLLSSVRMDYKVHDLYPICPYSNIGVMPFNPRYVLVCGSNDSATPSVSLIQIAEGVQQDEFCRSISVRQSFCRCRAIKRRHQASIAMTRSGNVSLLLKHGQCEKRTVGLDRPLSKMIHWYSRRCVSVSKNQIRKVLAPSS